MPQSGKFFSTSFHLVSSFFCTYFPEGSNYPGGSVSCHFVVGTLGRVGRKGHGTSCPTLM